MNSKDNVTENLRATGQVTRFYSASIYLLPLLHLIIALPLAYYLNIWMDEGSTLNTTENGFFAALQNTLQAEQQAPLYFWVLGLWRGINGSIFFARIFSIIASLFAIVVFQRLARKLWNERVAVGATCLFAIHPYLFWASLEIRVYALLILFSLILLTLFIDGYFSVITIVDTEEKVRKFSRITFPIAAVISLYTNYYLGFILVACFLVLLVFKKWREAKTYFLQMLVVGVFFLPLLWAMKIQLAIRNGGYFPETNPIEGIRLLWGHFLTLTLPTEFFPDEEGGVISAIRLWFVRFAGVFVLAILIAKRKLFEERNLTFGIFSGVILGFLYFSYFLLGGPMVAVRHVSILFVPLVLFLISVFVSISPKTKRNRLYYYAFIGISLSCSYVYALFSLHPNLTKTGDWERVGRFIEQNETQNQPIVVFPSFQAMTLPYHYTGKNKILPRERFHEWFDEAEHGTEGARAKQIEYYISIFPKESAEVWLLTYDDCQSTKACVPLEKYVEANYTVVKQKDFYNERVRLLKKK